MVTILSQIREVKLVFYETYCHYISCHEVSPTHPAENRVKATGYVDIKVFQQLCGGFQHGRRVVVAPGDDHLALQHHQLAQQFKIDLARFAGGIGHIEHIARHQEHINAVYLYVPGKPPEEQQLIFLQIGLVQPLANVEVGGMEEF